MTAAKTFQITEMVYINICTVTAHCLCHSENIFSARTHKCKPQPQCRYKFGILPSVTAHIISPTMTLCVICVHYIAVIPKTVPMSLFDFVLIKCKCFVKFFFKPFFKRCILWRQAPFTHSLNFVIIFRSCNKYRRFLYSFGLFHKFIVRRHCVI